MDEQETRDPLDAIDEIRAKVARGEEPTDDERVFLESEGVRLESDESGGEPVV
jgi:hypothetical protein